MPRTLLTCVSTMILVTALLTGCSSDEDRGPVDPSQELLTASLGSGDYASGTVVLRDLGTEPVQRRLTLPTGYDAVMFSVSCVPSGYDSVTLGGRFSADCNRTDRGGGTSPLEAIGTPTRVRLSIPAGTRRWLVAVALKTQD